jgi:hypothetical protein
LQEIQEALMEKAKNSFVKAEDLCEIVTSERLQALFARLGIHKPTISQLTAQWWLAKMKWQYRKMKNRMYIDGHERDNVVAYRQKFVHQWAAEYETRFPIWDNDGNRLTQTSDSLPLILVTQRIHLLPKRRKEDSLEPSRQPTNPQTERQQAVFDGLGFLDS